MASHAVFLILHFLNFFSWLRNYISQKAIINLTRLLVISLVAIIIIGLVVLTLAGKT